jgi:transposase
MNSGLCPVYLITIPKELGVSTSSIKSWKRLLNETGSLEKRPREGVATKFIDKELKTYIQEHPDTMLSEIAEKFGGSTSGAFDALNRVGITLKKRTFLH